MPESLWLIVALLASFLWGLVYALDQKVLEVLTPLELLCIYFLVVTPFCWTLLWATGDVAALPAKLARPNMRAWLAAAIGFGLLASWLILSSIKLSNATLAATIEISYPLFTVFFAWLLFGETQINRDVLIGGGLIFAGALWLSVKA